MNIPFEDQGEKRMACIIFDFKQVSDCLIMVFAEGFNEDILFYKQQEVWNSTSPMQKQNAATYIKLQQAILKALAVET